MRDNGAVEGGAAGFEVGDNVLVIKKHDTQKIYVVGHVNGVKECVSELVYIVANLLEERFTEVGQIDPIIASHGKAIIWDIRKRTMATIPNVTFPCEPNDENLLAWLEDHPTISESLWTLQERGKEYTGRGMLIGSYPDPTLPELDIPENTGCSQTAEGHWSEDEPPVWMATMSLLEFTSGCIKPLFTPGPYTYFDGQLLHSNITDAPNPYTAFRTSVSGSWLLTGDGLDYFPAEYTEGHGSFTVHSPFGVLDTYSESYTKYQYVAGDYIGPWPLRRAPQPIGVVGADNSICKRLYITRNYDGIKTEKSIVDYFICQRRNVTATLNSWLDYYPSDTVIFDNNVVSLADRGLFVHAQAKYLANGIDGEDFVTLGRSTDFETLLSDFINGIYASMTDDMDDTQDVWSLSLTVSIIE